ncbi:hypothetical protein CapIbe_018748 [Capra ibex]
MVAQKPSYKIRWKGNVTPTRGKRKPKFRAAKKLSQARFPNKSNKSSQASNTCSKRPRIVRCPLSPEKKDRKDYLKKVLGVDSYCTAEIQVVRG